MPSLEERVAYLEGRLADHASVVTDVQRATPEARALVEDLRARFDAVGDALNRKIDAVDERLGAKIDRHFMWLVGIQIATLVAIIGALLRR